MNRLSDTVEKLAWCNEILNLLINGLVDLLEEPGDHLKGELVLTDLESILENLREQCALEEQNGYLTDVLEQYPNWYPQVKQLKKEHRILCRELRAIRDQIKRASPVGFISKRSRQQLFDWIKNYDSHRKRESGLVQNAFTLEVGVGE